VFGELHTWFQSIPMSLIEQLTCFKRLPPGFQMLNGDEAIECG
jgi:hypothetical protein